MTSPDYSPAPVETAEYTETMLTRATILLLLAYLAVMALVVAGLLVARQRTLATLDTPEARRQWQRWKEQTAHERRAADPVERRPVKSDEPPALILLRDHFATIVAGTVTICSFMFGFLAFAARGAFGGGGRQP